MSDRPAFAVIGGSVLQLSLIEEVRARGLAVAVVDGAPDAVGMLAADIPIHQDWSDREGVIAALRAAGVEPVGVATMGTDWAMNTVARVAQEFALPGPSPEAALRATDKELMLASWREQGAAVAPSLTVKTRAEAEAAYAEIGPHVVVKPVDTSGQRGAGEVSSRAELERALDAAFAYSRSGRIVVEEYIDGREYTVSGFVVGGRYLPMIVTERILHPAPPIGVCIAHRHPSGLGPDDEAALHAAAGFAALALGIDAAPTYAQLRLGAKGPRMLEIGARLGGGKDAELCKLVRGVDQVEAVVDAALGRLGAESLRLREIAEPFGETRFIVRPPGLIERLDATDALALPGVHDAGFFWRVGQTLPTLQNGTGRLGYVIVTAPDATELERRTAAALAALDLQITPA